MEKMFLSYLTIYSNSYPEKRMTHFLWLLSQGSFFHGSVPGGCFASETSSLDVIAISEIWNYDPPTHSLTYWPTGVRFRICYCTKRVILWSGHLRNHISDNCDVTGLGQLSQLSSCFLQSSRSSHPSCSNGSVGWERIGSSGSLFLSYPLPVIWFCVAFWLSKSNEEAATFLAGLEVLSLWPLPCFWSSCTWEVLWRPWKATLPSCQRLRGLMVTVSQDFWKPF